MLIRRYQWKLIGILLQHLPKVHFLYALLHQKPLFCFASVYKEVSWTQRSWQALNWSGFFHFLRLPGSTDRGQSLSLIHCRGSIISTGNRDSVVFSFLRALMGSSLTIPSKQVTACLLEAGAKIDASRDNQGMLSFGLGWMFLDKLPSLKLT